MEMKAALIIFIISVLFGAIVNYLSYFIDRRGKRETKEELSLLYAEMSPFGKALFMTIGSFLVVVVFGLIDMTLMPPGMPLIVWFLLPLGLGVGAGFTEWLLTLKLARELRKI